jgi:hypothetical protein
MSSELASEPASETEPAPEIPYALDAADFNCAICLELLYKPCVNHCGHTFCFW